MTSERRLRIGDEVIRYSLKRSGRRKKTVGIRVAQVGLEVAAPTRTSIREIEEILQKRSRWILERMVAASQLPPAEPAIHRGNTAPDGQGGDAEC